MNPSDTKYQIAIVGGGPVGLYLGCLLQKAGISCVVLDDRAAPVTHSRSIGIHPVSLELFAELGIAENFIKEGVQVRRGLAFTNQEAIGTISFAACPPPYNFILTLPQYKTETILESHLGSLNPAIVQRNTRVTSLQESINSIQLTMEQNGKTQSITSQYVIGCDGINSLVRRAAGIPFIGKTYPDSYIMGDFQDNTTLGSDAAVFLCKEGLIESFPLSGNTRRWVVKTDEYLAEVHRQDIERLVAERIAYDLHEVQNTMLSSFGVQKKLAQTMVKSRIVLAGDAAHIVSPIGGQGMNLGWLDAQDLSCCLIEVLRNESSAPAILKGYSSRRLKVARKAIHRAEFNMFLGRKTRWPLPKKWLLAALLKTPLSHLLSRLFTMRGLPGMRNRHSISSEARNERTHAWGNEESL